MATRDILETLARGQHLSEEQALECFDKLFAGELSPAQSGALLLGLRAKGETPEELGAGVQAALKQARIVRRIEGASIDTCGTGGDGKRSFNCSTAVAFHLASMGYKVVKHGNRAVSSSCGSADVVEALGIPFMESPEDASRVLARSNFVFLFAPHFHPAFANIAPIRKELGIPTLFNLMGPLLNPARPTHQLLGVGNPKTHDLVARALAKSNVQRAAVVHGGGGFDELTPCGVSRVILVQGGRCEEIELDPESFGMRRSEPDELGCRDRADSLDMMRAVLKGQGPQPVLDMLGLNLGLSLHLLEESASLQECVERAKDQVRQGIDLSAETLGCGAAA